MSYNELIDMALKARKKAYVPYSNFAVGAAVLTKDNNMFDGGNIENAAYSPSNCAERTAIFKAVSEGHKEIVAIAIAGDYVDIDKPRDYCTPCGVCRQVMVEFANQEMEIILAKSQDDYKVYKLKELLPLSFNKNFLNK